MIQLVATLVSSSLPLALEAALVFLATKLPWKDIVSTIGSLTGIIGVGIGVAAILNTRSIAKMQEKANQRSLLRAKTREYVDRCRTFLTAYVDFTDSLNNVGHSTEALQFKVRSLGTDAPFLEILTVEQMGHGTFQNVLLRGKFTKLAREMEEGFQDFAKANSVNQGSQAGPKIIYTSRVELEKYQSRVLSAVKDLLFQVELFAEKDRFALPEFDTKRGTNE